MCMQVYICCYLLLRRRQWWHTGKWWDGAMQPNFLILLQIYSLFDVVLNFKPFYFSRFLNAVDRLIHKLAGKLDDFIFWHMVCSMPLDAMFHKQNKSIGTVCLSVHFCNLPFILHYLSVYKTCNCSTPSKASSSLSLSLPLSLSP